jgi:hypothetical protein
MELWNREIKIERINVMKDQLKVAGVAERTAAVSRRADFLTAHRRLGAGLIRTAQLRALAGVNDQFFFGEELERAIALHVHGVAKFAVRRRKHGDDDAAFMVVGRFIDLLSNRKFGHRELLPGSSARLSPQIS